MAIKIWTGGAGTGAWATAGNWSPATAPVAGDDVRIPASATVAITGSDTTAVVLGTFTVEPGCSIAIGSETTPLQLKVTTLVDLGGTGTMYLDVDAATVITVNRAGSAPAVGRYACNLRGRDNVALYVNCASNSESVCYGAALGDGGGAATWEIDTIGVTGGSLTLGNSQTNAAGGIAVTQSGGVFTAQSNASVATLTKTGGEAHMELAATTITLSGGGTTYIKHAGAITTATVTGPAILDCTKDLRTRTFTNFTMLSGAVWRDPSYTVTLTNGLDLYRCGINDVTIDRGDHFTIAFSAI